MIEESKPEYAASTAPTVRLLGLPIPQSAVFQTIHGQTFALIGIFGRERFVYVDAMTRYFAGGEVAVVEFVDVREYFIGLLAVRHVFLNTEVRHPIIEMQSRAHTDR